MNPSFLLFPSLIGVTVSIIIEGGGGGGGYNDHSGHHSHSDSRDSSGSHEHRPRPHKPRPTRPPRELTNCPTNWLLFVRPQGNWCAQAFVGSFTRDAADDICKTMGATLTGLQSSAERLRLAEAARQIAVQHKMRRGPMWLGGRAKPECTSPRACPDSRNSFYWTDGHSLNGTDAFTWNAGNPALEYGYKDVHHVYGISSCTTLTIVSNGGQINGYWNGLMDDMWCNAKQYMYACGKKAT
ncbi:hypothetical protein GCK72_003532 [Caenorhabditis remanei]|uniref:C-type lectin domain-containing protein n=1 Tax=Caenorhabditis remanei TaxID=31234 RepID=A0A6A5HVK5_CAERE|nr:hypothetical protein GCK72_003532 [Caenorhabditis remanei]KAF1771705.1 hypothetical protein GCK72_003532 [Caenorhabditis remanei]